MLWTDVRRAWIELATKQETTGFGDYRFTRRLLHLEDRKGDLIVLDVTSGGSFAGPDATAHRYFASPQELEGAVAEQVEVETEEMPPPLIPFTVQRWLVVAASALVLVGMYVLATNVS
jgi:hypothetical protein